MHVNITQYPICNMHICIHNGYTYSGSSHACITIIVNKIHTNNCIQTHSYIHKHVTIIYSHKYTTSPQ